MVKVYAAEIAHTKMRVNILDPGRVRTYFPGVALMAPE